MASPSMALITKAGLEAVWKRLAHSLSTVVDDTVTTSGLEAVWKRLAHSLSTVVDDTVTTYG